MQTRSRRMASSQGARGGSMLPLCMLTHSAHARALQHVPAHVRQVLSNQAHLPLCWDARLAHSRMCVCLTAQACCVLSAAVRVRLCCREEGMAGLWKGLGPNIARNAIINAAELASYDQIKVSLLATGEGTQSSDCVCWWHRDLACRLLHRVRACKCLRPAAAVGACRLLRGQHRDPPGGWPRCWLLCRVCGLPCRRRQEPRHGWVPAEQ